MLWISLLRSLLPLTSVILTVGDPYSLPNTVNQAQYADRIWEKTSSYFPFSDDFSVTRPLQQTYTGDSGSRPAPSAEDISHVVLAATSEIQASSSPTKAPSRFPYVPEYDVVEYDSSDDDDADLGANNEVDSFLDSSLDHDDTNIPSIRRLGTSGIFSQEASASTASSTSSHPAIYYRYYGRSRVPRNHVSIPFLLIGPQVNHWKVIGQDLANRGFSVMACERVPSDDEKQSKTPAPVLADEAATLIVELMDALRWNRVVLVGCDNESVLAIHAAMRLGGDRVVGLVLCGNLDHAQKLAAELEYPRKLQGGTYAIDRFLSERLKCPFTIVWDGDGPNVPSIFTTTSDASTSPVVSENKSLTRSLVLGGGSAPHRRRPQLFSWVLTRFVEEKVAAAPKIKSSTSRGGEQPLGKNATTSYNDDGLFGIPFFSSGSMVVVGRVLATALFYGTLMRVAIYQYENVRYGVLNVKSGVEMILSVRTRITRAITSLFTAIGSLFVFKRNAPQQEAPPDVVEEANDSLNNSTEPEEMDMDKDGNGDENMEPEPEFKPLYFLDHVIA